MEPFQASKFKLGQTGLWRQSRKRGGPQKPSGFCGVLRTGHGALGKGGGFKSNKDDENWEMGAEEKMSLRFCLITIEGGTQCLPPSSPPPPTSFVTYASDHSVFSCQKREDEVFFPFFFVKEVKKAVPCWQTMVLDPGCAWSCSGLKGCGGLSWLRLCWREAAIFKATFLPFDFRAWRRRPGAMKGGSPT